MRFLRAASIKAALSDQSFAYRLKQRFTSECPISPVRGTTGRAAAGLRSATALQLGTQETRRSAFYFSELLIEVNLVFKLEPRPLTTAMIARAMPAAINPYSMAVAPDWSCRKRAKSLVIG